MMARNRLYRVLVYNVYEQIELMGLKKILPTSGHGLSDITAAIPDTTHEREWHCFLGRGVVPSNHGQLLFYFLLEAKCTFHS